MLPEAQERLRSLGAWMKVNGKAIYATDASPFENLDWGRCTVGKIGAHPTLFLHVFDWPADHTLVISGLANQPIKAYELANPSKALKLTRQGPNLAIAVPETAPDPDCSVIALEIRGAPVVYNAPKVEAVTNLIVQPVTVILEAGSRAGEIRYTLDGSDPTNASPLYEKPIAISDSAQLAAQIFTGGKPVSAIVRRKFEHADLYPAMIPPSPQPGLIESTFAGSWDSLPDFSTLQPESSGALPTIGLSNWPPRENYGIRAQGLIKVPQDGVYVFSLGSDDGSRLTIDRKTVVDNDGTHTMTFKNGEIALAQGYHSIQIDYFNQAGASGLSLKWALAGEPLKEVSASELFNSVSE